MQRKVPAWLLIGIFVAWLTNGITLIGTATLSYKVSLTFSPTIRIIIAIGWGSLLTLLLIGLLRRLDVAFRVTAPLLTCYGVFNWLWEVFFAQADYARGSFGFRAVMTILLLIPVWWFHFRWRAKTFDRTADSG